MSLLIAMVMGMTQLFGLGGAYFCDCSGAPVKVETSSCVGPHGTNCHQGNASSSQTGGEQKGQEHKDHQKTSDDLQSTPIPSPAAVPAAFVAVLPVFLILPPPVFEVPRFSQVGVSRTLPPNIVVARTIVRLI